MKTVFSLLFMVATFMGVELVVKEIVNVLNLAD